jgi:hypothetical protein
VTVTYINSDTATGCSYTTLLDSHLELVPCILRRTADQVLFYRNFYRTSRHEPIRPDPDHHP